MKIDPKLKEAAAEIKAIFKKHDLAGHVIMNSPEHAEFLFEITPSWSCMFWETQPDGQVALRIRANKKSIPDSKERQAKVQATVDFIVRLRDLAAHTFEVSEELMSMLKKHIEIEELPSEGIVLHREN